MKLDENHVYILTKNGDWINLANIKSTSSEIYCTKEYYYYIVEFGNLIADLCYGRNT